MMMTNGLGATIGTLAAQEVVNRLVFTQSEPMAVWAGWQQAWYIFAAFALVVAIAFWIFFPKTPVKNS